mgnify:CR=1 FL=1
MNQFRTHCFRNVRLGRHLIIGLCAFAILIGLSGCARSNKASVDGVAPSVDAGSAELALTEKEFFQTSQSNVAQDSAAGAATAEETTGTISSLPSIGPESRQIIRNAKLSVEVEDLLGSTQEVSQQVNLVGGYVARTQVHYSEEQTARSVRRAWMTVRVPSASFDQTLQHMRELGVPQGEEIYTNDVTEEHLDLQARITNLEAQEEQLRRLLSETNDIGQIMEIYDRLAGVRSEIDRLQGRLQLIENQVAFSTIELTLIQTHATALSDPEAPVLIRAWQKLMNSLAAITTGVKEFVVWLGGAVPYLVLAGLAVWIGWRGWKTMRGRMKNVSSDS